MNTTIGILGGMGPLATVDFVKKIIDQTTASRDQDHLPLLVHCVPQIPDRTACLMQNRESPLAALEKGVHTLVGGGVGCIAIPCNTAHHWHGDLSRVSPVPILHIARACAEQLAAQEIGCVGIMATDGTLKAGFYNAELGRYGIRLQDTPVALQQQIMEAVYRVKSGALQTGARMLEDCLQRILESGVERVILGCTEIPLALDSVNSRLSVRGIDATDALAKACIAWHRAQSNARAVAA
ncbi:aspartate/glutamate racemase family protein [Marinobacterium rhizophilum]|uniref:aspartate/glutamate racemase family protein n=1 Tax=Marinobacterium rhizophilum TaxID=420402 RepID=UPI0003A29F9E|nr:amino acid racemase [Marinobacterium rhizophilum]